MRIFHFKNMLGKKYQEGDLYHSCMLLKNLAMTMEETSISADFIFEMLADVDPSLRPVYHQMLSYYRSGNQQVAFEYFAEEVNTKEAKIFAGILCKLDQIAPKELASQLEILQHMIEEKRMTQAIKRVLRKSVIGTFFSTMTIFAFFINFAVVVVFIDTLRLLESLF